MKPTHIILHHSLTADGKTVSWQAIRHYHMSFRCEGRIIAPEHVKALIGQGAPVERPWSDIGYHFGVELVNQEYEILMGRMPTRQGAHCTAGYMNRCSIGICFVGNFDLAPPPARQWSAGLRLVRALMDAYAIPAEKVKGHREYDFGKSCPGLNFDLNQFRRELPSV